MSIYKKLFEAKKEIGKISKDSTNPFYKSKYFDINQLLEHVEPILQKHGLLLIQPIEQGFVKSILCDVESETPDNVLLSEIQLTGIQDPQKIGSEITYYRRYTLQSLLGLQAEDDDANATVKTTPTQSKVADKDKKWLNKFTDKTNTYITKDWEACIKKLKDGHDVQYLRDYYKISNAVAELLEDEILNG